MIIASNVNSVCVDNNNNNNIYLFFLYDCTMLCWLNNLLYEPYDLSHVEKNRKVHKSAVTVPLQDWTS